MDLFFIGMSIGALVGLIGLQLVATMLDLQLSPTGSKTTFTVLLLIPGLIGGGLALIYRRPLIILCTAFYGGLLMTWGLALIARFNEVLAALSGGRLEELKQIQHTDFSVVGVPAWVILGVIGSVVQFFDEEADMEDEEEETEPPA